MEIVSCGQERETHWPLHQEQDVALQYQSNKLSREIDAPSTEKQARGASVGSPTRSPTVVSVEAEPDTLIVHPHEQSAADSDNSENNDGDLLRVSEASRTV